MSDRVHAGMMLVAAAGTMAYWLAYFTAGAVQTGPLGDRRLGDVPDAPEVERECFRRLQQIFRATCLVFRRPSPLVHAEILTHAEMR